MRRPLLVLSGIAVSALVLSTFVPAAFAQEGRSDGSVLNWRPISPGVWEATTPTGATKHRIEGTEGLQWSIRYLQREAARLTPAAQADPDSESARLRLTYLGLVAELERQAEILDFWKTQRSPMMSCGSYSHYEWADTYTWGSPTTAIIAQGEVQYSGTLCPAIGQIRLYTSSNEGSSQNYYNYQGYQFSDFKWQSTSGTSSFCAEAWSFVNVYWMGYYYSAHERNPLCP